MGTELAADCDGLAADCDGLEPSGVFVTKSSSVETRRLSA